MRLRDRLDLILQADADLKITPGTISRDLGHTTPYIHMILNGKIQRPGDEFFDYFKVRFNVNPQWLHTGEGEMFLEGGRQNNTRQAVLFSKILMLEPQYRDAIILLIDGMIAGKEPKT